MIRAVGSFRFGRILTLVLLIVLGAALYHLQEASRGVTVVATSVDGTPATIYRPASGPAGPAVVIAHGFAGSQQLMQSFALTFARNGYVAVTFDFPGHGRNPQPLTGSIVDVDGATRTLVAATTRIVEMARGLGDGRLAILGHSMASDIVVRTAGASPFVAATIAVSMFSPAVTATEPHNLLVIAGDWEGMLKEEALRAVSLVTAPAAAQPGRTYGDFALGTARRAAFSAHVEHVSVLFSQDSMREATEWLDRSFGISRSSPVALDGRGPWIFVLLAAVVGLARQLAPVLPQVAAQPIGAGLGWRRLWPPLVIPAIVTPLVLRVVPTHFLPVLVGDYLAVHFAVYGLITGLWLWLIRRPGAPSPLSTTSPSRFALAALATIGFGFVGLVWPVNSYVTSFVPGPERIPLLGAMLIGTLPYFLADEWMTRGAGSAKGAYPASKLFFLLSLALAVALDFERLFFIVIIIPVIVPVFLVHGLISRWVYRRTCHPLVGGLANAIAFAWAIGVTFPLLAG